MNFEIGDLVTRESHNHDMVFRIIRIEDDICYLKGVNIRLMADSPMDDIVKYQGQNDKEEEAFLDRIKPVNTLDRNDYFYLPGKVLHIDADHLCNSEFEKVL